ncbi:carbohydrate porin [Lichenibacterium minor]|uniref:Carbohydrate porin n=1 Tax=Lichenibacterium minor TaxID=2316528 RepID=A0A4Q2UH28_9HYPH|nr:carbohydrate porin [Lichenibacterium minor]RYC33995.1 carbohydrate porin [Lichenibacterium minor]
MAAMLALWTLGLTAVAPAQEAAPTPPAPAAPAPRAAPRAARRPVRHAAAVGSNRAVGRTGEPIAAPGRTAAATGPGAARGASGTAGGIGGARRVGNLQGTSASPTTPTGLPPGTLDFGNGITMLANYTSESAGNPVGGIRQGVRYADQFFFGTDIDLQKLAGVSGAFLHGIFTQRDGHSLSNDLIGNSISVQEIYGGGQTYRLTYLSLEKKLFDDRVDVEVGRIPGQTAFLGSPYYCNFQNNSVCGSPTVAFTDTNFTYFPAPTWAGVLKTQLTDRYFFNVGAYQVAPESTTRADHGVGFFAPSTGFNVPFELGYATSFKNDPYPRHYGVGAIIDRSTYTDAAFDRQGGSPVLTGLPGVQRFGRTAAYGRFDQYLYRPDLASPRGLSVFALAIAGTGGHQVEDYEFELGGVYLGPFASRPLDSLDVVVSTQHYSDIGVAGIRASRIAAGLSTNDIDRQQTFLELNYGIQVAPYARLTPNIQYILGPDQIREPSRPKPIPDVLVIGAKLSVDLFTLAGLAKGPEDRL